MTIKELLGEKYKDDMTIIDVEKALEGVNLADLSSGRYVKKEKYEADTRELAELRKQVESKQAEIDDAVLKATTKVRGDMEKDFKRQLDESKIAAKRKNAEQKAFGNYTEQQQALLKAFIKADDLKLDEEKEEFSNFEELAKTVKENFTVNFPTDDGGKGKVGVGLKTNPVGDTSDDLFGFKKLYGDKK